MGILQQLAELEDKLAKAEGWKGHLDKMEAKEWEEKYWITVRSLMQVQEKFARKFSSIEHLIIRAQKSEEGRFKLVARIMELELLLSCIRRVGEGVHVEHKRMQEIYKLYPDLKQFIHGEASWGEPLGLSSSKYVRK